MLEKYLEDLENRIDADVEEELLSQWKGFFDGEMNAGVFCPSRKSSSPSSLEWPQISVNEALDDFNQMALQQLSTCSSALDKGTGAIMNVRANYGTGILASVFGAEIFIMDAKLNTLPTSKPLNGGTDTIKRILDNGIPDLHTGYGDRCLAMGKHFVNLFADYPKVSRHVHIYHPDLQGPMDICELLWGSGVFIDLVDNPDLVKALLKLITDTYTRFMRAWERINYPRNDYSFHWGMLQKGRIMLRDDSAMNLSPEMFDEFIQPYDQQLLSEFNGGAIHFCGKGDHYIDRFHQMTGVFAVNMSQPEYNDMETVFSNTVDKGIRLIDLSRDAVDQAVREGRDLHGKAHCWQDCKAG